MFGEQDKETCYNKTIMSYLYQLFGTTIGYDKLNPLLILPYISFEILNFDFFGGLAT